MSLQPQLNYKMRAILIDWLILVQIKFNLLPETLYLTVSIIDRFLEVKLAHILSTLFSLSHSLTHSASNFDHHSKVYTHISSQPIPGVPYNEG